MRINAASLIALVKHPINWYRRTSEENKRWNAYELEKDILFIKTGVSYEKPRRLVWFENAETVFWTFIGVVIFSLVVGAMQWLWTYF